MRTTRIQRERGRLFGPSLTATIALALGFLVGCGGGGGGGGINGIPGIGSSVPELPGQIAYSGPSMITPRYNHTATVLPNGDVLIVGGSDESHFTALGQVEIFVEDMGTPVGQIPPESLVGDFIDQDIDGNLIVLPTGGRYWHTATPIDTSGRVLITGGTTNLLFGVANPSSTIFDPLTRTFDDPAFVIDPTEDILIPRVRHTVNRLPDGRLIVIGGQESAMVSQPGGPTQRAFATVTEIEIFDPSTRTFEFAVDPSMVPVELTSNRGRGGHAAVSFAGFDQILGTGDDLIAVMGGFDTISPASLMAPTTLNPWNPATSPTATFEFYSVASQSVIFGTGIVLTPRVNDPIAINLGEDRRVSPDGITGMANAVLVFGGDSDDPCPDGLSSNGENTEVAEVIVATFTGFGVANGAQFSRMTGTDMVNVTNPGNPAMSNTYESGHEILIHDQSPAAGCQPFSRSRGTGVLMDMRRVYDNPTIVSVVVAAGGSDISETMVGCQEVDTSFCFRNEVGGYSFFDPFWDPAQVGTVLPLNADLNGDGDDDLFPWTIVNNITPQNPTGIQGLWLSYDTLVPDETITGYADGFDVNSIQTVGMKEARSLHTMTRIAGRDGIVGNLDDRILILGGSDSYYPAFGLDPSVISCEIFVPPDGGP